MQMELTPVETQAERPRYSIMVTECGEVVDWLIFR